MYKVMKRANRYWGTDTDGPTLNRNASFFKVCTTIHSY